VATTHAKVLSEDNFLDVGAGIVNREWLELLTLQIENPNYQQCNLPHIKRKT
jgi:hypothetical protein